MSRLNYDIMISSFDKSRALTITYRVEHHNIDVHCTGQTQGHP